MRRRLRRRDALVAFLLAVAFSAVLGAVWSGSVWIVAGVGFLFYVVVRDELLARHRGCGS